MGRRRTVLSGLIPENIVPSRRMKTSSSVGLPTETESIRPGKALDELRHEFVPALALRGGRAVQAFQSPS